MSGLTKLSSILSTIFVITVVAILAAVIYVLWRRRVFHRKTNTTSVVNKNGDQLYSSSESSLSPITSSKELLYFLFIRSNSALDNNLESGNNSTANNRNPKQQVELQVIDFDLMKIQGMFGPPRFLLTVKEDEKEDVEKPVNLSGDKNVFTEGINLDCLEDVTIEIDDTTPFSTPCASPLYFTPSSSPVHEAAFINNELKG